MTRWIALIFAPLVFAQAPQGEILRPFQNAPQSVLIAENTPWVSTPEPPVEIQGFLPLSLDVSTTTVREYIEQRADETGVDRECSVGLADFESDFHWNAKNPKSTAKGVYQFIDSSWKSMCIGDVENYKDNVDCYFSVIQTKGGIFHWLADPATRHFLRENKCAEKLAN